MRKLARVFFFGVSVAGALALLLLCGLELALARTPETRPNPAGELAPSGKTTLTFLALSDLKSRSGVLLAAYDDARARGAGLVVIGGDLVQMRSPFEFRYGVSLVEKAPPGVPVHVVFGNHEAWDRHDNYSDELFVRTFGPRQGWFAKDGVLFVSLDTSDYAFPEERAREAERFLAAERPRARRCVVLTHVMPRWPGGPALQVDGRGQPKLLPDADSSRLLALVDGHAVDLVLGGHYHGFAAARRGAAELVLTGGGGAPLETENEFFNYVVVTIGPGGVSHELVKVPLRHPPEWIRYLLLQNALPAGGGGLAALVLGAALARLLRPSKAARAGEASP